MSRWATLYRPNTFAEVVGQSGAKEILQKLLLEGKAFRQSYILAGPSGTGKTTLARIVAMSMLCRDRSKSDFEPCLKCSSCQEILSQHGSFAYRELDAANQGGKENIIKIVDEAAYTCVDGSDRRIYCIDESHRLSDASMDALLKPLEDEIPGTPDKRLVVIFCTTDLDKMRGALRSRCMTLRLNTPNEADIALRLELLLNTEKIPYEKAALPLIIYEGKGHVRDMVSALERVAATGNVTVQNARTVLGHDTQDLMLTLIERLNLLNEDPVPLVDQILQRVSVSNAYQMMVSTLLAIAQNRPGFLAPDQIKSLHDRYGATALVLAKSFMDYPAILTPDHFVCEVMIMRARLLGFLGQSSSSTVMVVQAPQSPPIVETSDNVQVTANLEGSNKKAPVTLDDGVDSKLVNKEPARRHRGSKFRAHATTATAQETAKQTAERLARMRIR